ncbi:MAG: hypothetical protein H8E44_30115 [Planctomycetes bacterium]|nr:hypothetical protein [Planctomycetota bacterium]MBL7039638.1 hypothetical protein [Pirellulaceae bacterium]
MTSRRRTRSFLSIAAVALLALPAFAADVPDQLPDLNGRPDAKKEAPEKAHFDPVIENIEGWTVHVDPLIYPPKGNARLTNPLARRTER